MKVLHLFLTISLIVSTILLTSCSNKSSNEEELSLYSAKKTIQTKEHDQNDHRLKIGIASVNSPQLSLSKYNLLIRYLEKNLHLKIEVIQKQTYKEINDMLKNGKVDFAFICSLSYVIGMKEGYLEGVAVPEINGSTLYRSYTIVGKNSNYHNIKDLEGKKFAFTDPYSYSGRLSLLMELHTLGKNPEQFFSHTYYTYSHDNSIKSVALGIVDGASVDGQLYESMKTTNPDLISQTKIIGFGEESGSPPFVSSKEVNQEIVNKVQAILFNLAETNEGKNILGELGIDRYVPIHQENYKTIEKSLYLFGEKP
ncbi:phosphate/phosphite/phosphonate ABC transporter substrate-binding protein [Cytobacillus sp. Hz8]|uniref:substrate-binding domain-containing protein n=1 Tax=Cytobacillus sp. Hz8 TaxID=3347168 RepID=UPI0035D8F505